MVGALKLMNCPSFFPSFLQNQLSQDEYSDWQTYRNEEYGFEMKLPAFWTGYSVLSESWEGHTIDGKNTEFHGPKIVIRNPNWSGNQPWQDIPILVFTKEEWQLIEEENLNISAAPIGPIELGWTQQYVFALPPRWIGFTDNLGQDEAQEIAKTFKISAENWQTYRNEEYGFEFQYPEDWNLTGVTENPFNVTIWKRSGFNEDNIQIVEVYGFVSRGSVEDNINYIKTFSANFDELKEISIIGGKGFYWINEGKGGPGPTIYLIGKNQVFLMGYNIYDVSSKDPLSQAELLFNQIISTFRFVE
jgi:hypothetical protein